MLGTRRDRLLILLLLGALLSADLYFHLWPQVRRRLAQAGPGEPGCSCPRGAAPPSSAPTSSSSPRPESSSPPRPLDSAEKASSQAGGSKLRRLFAHPLFSAPDEPAEKLLSGQDVLRYYRRKVARWNR